MCVYVDKYSVPFDIIRSGNILICFLIQNVLLKNLHSLHINKQFWCQPRVTNNKKKLKQTGEKSPQPTQQQEINTRRIVWECMAKRFIGTKNRQGQQKKNHLYIVNMHRNETIAGNIPRKSECSRVDHEFSQIRMKRRRKK